MGNFAHVSGHGQCLLFLSFDTPGGCVNVLIIWTICWKHILDSSIKEWLILFGCPYIIISNRFDERTDDMMEYMSAPQAAEKWGISERRVQKLCENNRIPGVTKLGYMWLIPKNTKKPADGRRKENKLR